MYMYILPYVSGPRKVRSRPDPGQIQARSDNTLSWFSAAQALVARSRVTEAYQNNRVFSLQPGLRTVIRS